MNLVQIRTFLRGVEDGLIDKDEWYSYYNQVIMAFQIALGDLEAGCHGSPKKYDNHLIKASLERIIRVSVNALYDLVPFDTK